MLINSNVENQLLKKRADEAFASETWFDAAKYYTDFLNKNEGDYETNFRCLLSKSQCTGNIFNGLPYIGKSIELSLSELSNYAKELLKDNSLSDEQKLKRINYAIKLIEGSIWWIFNSKKEIYIDSGNTNIIHTNDGYIKLLNTLEECFDYYNKFFNSIINVAKYIPEIYLERKKVIKWGYNLLTWYDHTYIESVLELKCF